MRRFAAVLAALVACGGDDESTPLPCDVEQVVADECRLCHNAKLEFGAPMPLLTWEDTQETAPTDPQREVWEVMEIRVGSATSPMPPGGVGDFTTDERAVLDAWFQAGAPPGTGHCE